MLHEDLKEDCLWVWEEEGGNTGSLRGHSEEERALPALPPGCTSQPVWGFPDPSGRLYYEFHRVYRTESVYRDGKELLEHHLDPQECYWTVTWTGRSQNGDEYPAARWISYRQAHKLRPRLSFTQFSTSFERSLPTLLHIEDIELSPPDRWPHPSVSHPMAGAS